MSKARIHSQPNAADYSAANYDSFSRWTDYWYQLSSVVDTTPETVLEVGIGPGTLGHILKKRGYKYKSVDVDKNLKPDFVGDVRKLQMKDNSFDTVCAFEVLEHLPFRDFTTALSELRRVAKNYVIISLPYACFYISFAIQLFYIERLKYFFKLLKMQPFEPKDLSLIIPLSFLNKKGMIKEHYWEMGRKNYSRKRILNMFRKVGFEISHEASRILLPYHRFYILKKI